MDFPLFHLDWTGNRLLIAVIGIVHVLINHSMAVGAIPLITLLEWRGHKSGEVRWDRLAFRLLAVCFIVTTSLGALTGVGIWFSVALVNPHAIGSLIRVFFWAWFAEWLVFVTEVGLILAYYLTWKGWGARNKARHIRLGLGLSVASWCTMGIIVAILAFMMEPGTWTQQRSFWSGVLNPIYLPQLMFRTPLAMLMAGLLAMLLVPFFTERGEFRHRAMRCVSAWTFAWSLPCIAGAWAYWQVIPEVMKANLAVGLTTQAFEKWYGNIATFLKIASVAMVIVAMWGTLKPGWLPRPVTVLPFIAAMLLVGSFERVREFVRKPAVLHGYMYANGIEIGHYPLLREQGVLAHATYCSQRTVTPENRIQAGQDMFMIACSRCHTTAGINGITNKLQALYGNKQWSHDVVLNYIKTMHNVRPFMPPAPGTDAELSALTDYIISLRKHPAALAGAQTGGVAVPPVVLK